jgi:hypothetical protein
MNIQCLWNAARRAFLTVSDVSKYLIISSSGQSNRRRVATGKTVSYVRVGDKSDDATGFVAMGS